jgi:hypothetical protein
MLPLMAGVPPPTNAGAFARPVDANTRPASRQNTARLRGRVLQEQVRTTVDRQRPVWCTTWLWLLMATCFLVGAGVGAVGLLYYLFAVAVVPDYVGDPVVQRNFDSTRGYPGEGWFNEVGTAGFWKRYRLRHPAEVMGEPGQGADTKDVDMDKVKFVEPLVKVKAVKPQMPRKLEDELEYNWRHLDTVLYEERRARGKGHDHESPEASASNTITQNAIKDAVVSLKYLPTYSWRRYPPTMAAKLKMTAMEKISRGDWQDAAAAAKGGEASITPRRNEAKDDLSRQTTLKCARVQVQLRTDDEVEVEPGGSRRALRQH